MKIVVLAGGLSPERNVSLSSGAMVCQALRSKGHAVALIDLFFGRETCQAEDPFQASIPQEYLHVSPKAPDLAEVRSSRKDRSPSAIGPGVLDLCSQADVVYLALHGARMAASRPPWTCWASPIPVPAAWAPPSPWIRI